MTLSREKRKYWKKRTAWFLIYLTKSEKVNGGKMRTPTPIPPPAHFSGRRRGGGGQGGGP